MIPPPGSGVLVVDDDERLRERLARALRERGYAVVAAAEPEQALAALAAQEPEYAVLDLRLGASSGLALLPRLLAVDPELRVVVLTGYGSISTAVDAVRLGAVDYLTKPADADMVLAALGRAPEEPRSAEYEPPTLARAEWEHIQRVLDDCGGNVSLAARKLGLHRRSLQRKLGVMPPRR